MFKNKMIKAAALLSVLFSTSPIFAEPFWVRVDVKDNSTPYDENSPFLILPSERGQQIGGLFYCTTAKNDLDTLFWGPGHGSGKQSIAINEEYMKDNTLRFRFEMRGSSAGYSLHKVGKDEALETIPLEKDGKQLRSLKLTLKGSTGSISDLKYGEPHRRR